MSDCIFCKIVSKQIPADIVYEDEHTMAFKDINGAAPVHMLIIPKKHIGSLNEINEDNADIMSRIHITAKKVAEIMSIVDTGYRIICNCGRDAGQTVFHLHLHLVGGKFLGERVVT